MIAGELLENCASRNSGLGHLNSDDHVLQSQHPKVTIASAKPTVCPVTLDKNQGLGGNTYNHKVYDDS